MKTTKNWLQNLLMRWDAPGVTCNEGMGNATRRGLA
jgi:hypothetical protein